MSPNRPRILIVDPTPIIALGLQVVINQNDIFETETADCETPEEVANAVSLVRPNLLIINPLISGLRLEAHLAGKLNGAVIALLYSNMRSLPIMGYRQAIVSDMSPREISDIIESLLKKNEENPDDNVEKTLSPREIDVVILVAKGMTNKEIARYLSLSIHTVITHRRNITRKLDIHSVSGLTMYAIMNQLVSLEDTKMK